MLGLIHEEVVMFHMVQKIMELIDMVQGSSERV